MDKVINPLFLVGSRIPENFLDTFDEADKLNKEQVKYFYCLDTVDDSSFGDIASFVIDKSNNLCLYEKKYDCNFYVFEDNKWKLFKDPLDTIAQFGDKPWKLLEELDTKNVSIRKTNKAYQMARSARFEK